MTVRTRVAPSPTGDPHVGTGYVALFNYCFAKAHGGQFVLRIEDTDQARSTAASEQMILDSLRWLGLSWDEGPDVGGPHGPYRQSERGALYAAEAERLLAAGHAYRCFHTAEELAALRSEGPQQGFKSKYRDLDAAGSAGRAAAGEPFVVRMKVPHEGVCTVQDRLRGKIEIEWAQVDEQILLKSDGMPTYHLANVVDDHHMGITHVLRGEEWISSAPKHLLLYQYFGWEAPELCHLPLLRNPDKSKLSKRKNPTSIRYYERMGYLPVALLNYLGRMAWSMPDERERFSLAEMIAHFDLDRVSLGGPVFDVAKLSWLNGLWIREGLDDQGFAEAVKAWALNEAYLRPMIPLVRERVQRLSDLGPMLSFFFAGDLNPSAADLAVKKRSPDEVRQGLVYAQWHLDTVVDWESESIQRALRDLAAMTGTKLRDLLAPMFVALTGSASSTPLFQTMELLGRDLSRARLRSAVDALGGLSGKLSAKLRKDFDALVLPVADLPVAE